MVFAYRIRSSDLSPSGQFSGRRRDCAGKRFIVIFAVIGVTMTIALAGCAGGGGDQQKRPDEMTIAYQPGLAYAPFIIMKEKGWLEDAFPDTKIKWKMLSSGAAVRDGILSGEINVGAVGPPPFFTAWQQGTDWKVISSTQMIDHWLVTTDSSVKSLKDIKPSMKIAVPSPDSTNALFVRWQAKQELGDAKALDGNFVSIGHPDAVQALLGKQITAGMSSPPFQFKLVDEGARVLFRDDNTFGWSSATLNVAKADLYERFPEFVEKFYKFDERAKEILKNDPAEAGTLYAKGVEQPELADQVLDWLKNPHGVRFEMAPRGVMKQAKFMKEIGQLSKTPDKIEDIEFPTLKENPGS